MRIYPSLELTSTVLAGIDEVYWRCDLVNEELRFSPQLLKQFGCNEQVDKDGVRWQDFLDRETYQKIKAKIVEYVKGLSEKIDVTFAITNKSGEEVWLHAVGKVVEYVDGGVSVIAGNLKDVSSSQKLLRQLKKQNERLMLAKRFNKLGYWRYDIKSDVFEWSNEVFRIHGLTNQSLSPDLNFVVDSVSAKDRVKLRECIQSAINQQLPFEMKTAITKSKGRKIKVEIIAEVELDGDGNTLSVFGAYKDITRNEDLFEKLKLLAMVNYTIKVPIFFIDDNDNVVYQDISPHHDSASAVLFNHINFSISEYLQFKRQAKEQGQVKENNVSFDKYTTVFDLSVTYESEEGIYIWIVDNVTDKFRKEQQQVISNRLALLGNTFGNVSHDINNVLGVALGAIEMLEIKFSRGEKDISPYIERVKNAIDKGKNVTERLLAFTRKPTIKVVSFDPLQDIHDNQYLFKQLLLSTINLSFKFEPIHCSINFPQGEFINILLNLVLNAQDAIQEQGVSGQIEISANLLGDNQLQIHIKDSGIGIAKENITKIFDPFYSSKSVNKGNGIGLANVYSTMYKHNGLIQVQGESELGGAHFTLVFKCEVSQEHLVNNIAQPPALSYKNTNILVLDDEVSIGEFVALFLESKGANVTVANTKEELIDKINEASSFDIFITDMILPDLTGKEAVNMVLEKFNDIKIYSMSGYIAIEDRVWEYPVLRKPFNSKDLAEFLAI